MTQIDEKLLKTYDDANEIESSVLETEEINDKIMDKIVRARRYIELKSTNQVSRPVSQSLVTSQSMIPQSQDTPPDSHS